MRISDWSSDVCSSEAAAERRKVKSALIRRFAPPSPAGGRRAGSLLGRRSLALEQPEPRNPHRPTHDPRIRVVDRRPIVFAPVPLTEVDPVPVAHAVAAVATRAAHPPPNQPP